MVAETPHPAATESAVPPSPDSDADLDRDETPRELSLLVDQEFVEVSVPYGAAEYTCPGCEHPIKTRSQIHMAKPARFAHLLNDVQKCPHCGIIFSYKLTTVRVLRS